MSLRKEQTTKRIDFEDGDWIDIKENRNYGDTVHAQRAAAIRRISSSKKDDKKGDEKSDDGGTFDFDVVSFNLALLERMIVAWSDDEPVNKETIQELPNDIVQKVLGEITDTMEEQDEETKKD